MKAKGKNIEHTLDVGTDPMKLHLQTQKPVLTSQRDRQQAQGGREQGPGSVSRKQGARGGGVWARVTHSTCHHCDQALGKGRKTQIAILYQFLQKGKCIICISVFVNFIFISICVPLYTMGTIWMKQLHSQLV